MAALASSDWCSARTFLQGPRQSTHAELVVINEQTWKQLSIFISLLHRHDEATRRIVIDYRYSYLAKGWMVQELCIVSFHSSQRNLVFLGSRAWQFIQSLKTPR